MVNRQVRRSRPLFKAKTVSLAVASCFSFSLPVAYANPTGPSVINGQVAFSAQGNTLSITNTPGSIINWRNFSIGSSELTRFIQQSATSSVLNRVVGADPSVILGALQSNGRVFLINPSGILFGAGAQVDVAGLVASSLNLSNADFLAGRMRFTEVPGAGAVANQGSIATPTGGQVYLVAPNVQNSGIITSPRGEIILAAGRSVELVDAGTPALRVELTAPDNEAVNVGRIIADSGKVGIYAGLIRSNGVIRADGVVAGENGEILLKATQGTTIGAGSTISANGADGGKITIQSGDTTLVAGNVEARGSAGSGGTVQVLGNRVGLVDNAVVDASGHAGGGTVLVGGDYQGRNPDVQNAFRTYVGEHASIKADALADGDGGKVIVWSDDATRVHGSISARGGAQAGNGGFVETSGHRLEVTRGPDVSAPNGAAGTWLLDPVNLAIVAGSALVNNTGAPFFDPLGDSSSVGVTLINAQLDLGSNVILTTTSQGPTDGSQAGNITVSAPILKQAQTIPGPGGVVIGPTSLTLQAHNDIIIEGTGSITSTGDPLSVSLLANMDGVGGGGVTVGGAITTRGGFVSIQGRDLVALNAPVHTIASTGTGGGSVSVNSTAGAVQVSSAVTSGSSFSAIGATGVSVAAPVVSGGGISLGSSTGAITVAAPVTGSGATLTADDMAILAVVNAGTGSITVQPSVTGRPMDLGSNPAGALGLTQAELTNLVTSGGVTFGSTQTGPLTISAPIAAGSSSVTLLSGSSIAVNPGASLTTAVPLIANAPAINVNGAVTAGGNINLVADTMTVNAQVTATAGDISVSPRTFNRAMDLGTNPIANALALSSAEINRFVTSGVLRFGNTSTGPINISSAIAPAGTNTLSLVSRGAIGQTAGATISETNLRAFSSQSSVDLMEANNVGTLAGRASNMAFGFANAAGAPLAIGNVDGSNGVTFSGNGIVRLNADNMTIGSQVSAGGGGLVEIQPVLAATKLNLGGADAAGVLGISAGELANIQAFRLVFKADQADISAPITSPANTMVIAPMTVGRALNIVSGAKNAANLEFVQSDLNNVTATSFVLGDSPTGPITVGTNATIPATVGTFTLRTGDTATGIVLTTDDTVSLSATGNLVFNADTINVLADVTSTAGSITVIPHTAGRAIALGANPANTLGLDVTEIGHFVAPAGTLVIGDGNSGTLTSSVGYTLSNVQNLSLSSGTLVTITPHTNGPITPNGSIFISAPEISIDAATTAAGDVNLTGDVMTILSPVSSTGGSINVAPLTFRTIVLGGADVPGSTLGLTQAELLNLDPSNAGVLRIGNFTTTGHINVAAAISPTTSNTLSLQGTGNLTQAAGATITVPNLAASVAGSILLDESNNPGAGTHTVALQGGFGSSINFTHAGANPLNIGTVDGVFGIQAFNGGVNVRSNEVNILSNISASVVTLRPRTPGTAINVGTNVGGQLSFDQAELNLISANSNVIIGDAASGNLVVSAPVSSSFSDLTLTTGGTINTASTLANTSGNITMVADSMTFGGGVGSVSAPVGTIALRPLSAIPMDLGGADVPVTPGPGVLGLDSTDLDALSAAALSFGSSNTPLITVSAVTNLGTKPATLTTSGSGTGQINVNAPLTSGNLTLATDNLVLGAGVNAPGVTLKPVTGGRTLDLGTAITGNALGLDQAQLNRITTPALAFDFFGNINVSAPVSFASSNLTLLADTMSVGNTITNTAGGRIIVAPASNFRAMNLGSKPANALGLTPLEISRLVTSGVVQLGELGLNTASILISDSIAPASGVSTLTLASFGSITQSDGKVITAPNLLIQTTGTVDLAQNNSVGMLAGSSSGSFTFTGAGSLNVGTVDSVNGISDSTISLKADTLTISQAITGGNVTLAPRTAGAAMDLGSKPGGFGITDAEMDMVSASTLTFGNNTAGPVNVSAPMSRAAGTLNIVTGPTQSVGVNAALSGQSNVAVTGGTINVAAPVSSAFGSVTLNAQAPTTLNVNAAVSARNNVTLTSDVINVAAPVTSTNGTVTFQPHSDKRPIDLGSDNAGALSITSAEVNQVSAPTLVVGRTSSGDLKVTAPIMPAGVTNLSLVSGGTISQNPGATIVTRKVVDDTPQGSLSVTGRAGVNLPEANDVGTFLVGSAPGTTDVPKADFVFNNVSPLKLQQVSISASGKRRVNAGFFESSSPLQLPPEILCVGCSSFDRSIDFPFEERKKDDQEKNTNETEISPGLNAQCS